MMSDKEASGYMDETMRLFDLYKKKYTIAIERKHKEIEIKVFSIPEMSHYISVVMTEGPVFIPPVPPPDLVITETPLGTESNGRM
jgi:hypothetical protein